MVSRKDIQVKQLKVSDKQMQEAIKRASENVKTYVIWEDSKAAIRNKQTDERNAEEMIDHLLSELWHVIREYHTPYILEQFLETNCWSENAPKNYDDFLQDVVLNTTFDRPYNIYNGEDFLFTESIKDEYWDFSSHADFDAIMNVIFTTFPEFKERA